MKLFEIINPSDKATFWARDIVEAGVAMCLLGDGYGAFEVGNEENSTPVLWGWNEWFDSHGIPDGNEYVNANRPSLAAALRSVALGSADDRRDFDDAVESIKDPDDRREFIERRNGRRRSGINNFESAAHRIADRLMEVHDGQS